MTIFEAFQKALNLKWTPTTMEQVWAVLDVLDDAELQAAIDRASMDGWKSKLRLHSAVRVPESWQYPDVVVIDLDGPPDPEAAPLVADVATAACGKESGQYAHRWVVLAPASEVPAVEAALRALAAGDPEPARRYVWDRYNTLGQPVEDNQER